MTTYYNLTQMFLGKFSQIKHFKGDLKANAILVKGGIFYNFLQIFNIQREDFFIVKLIESYHHSHHHQKIYLT